MSTAPKRHYTPEEYLALEAESEVRHEYYQGEIFAMAGASRVHNTIARQLFGRLFIQLDGKDCVPHSSETRVRVQATGLYTYPDVSVACKPLHYEAGGSETLLNPRVLAEVLSESTEEHDIGFKLKHYRKIPSLQELFFFSQDEPLAERYVRDGKNRWVLSSISGLDAVVDMPSIGCAVPMSLIYAGIALGEEDAAE